MISEERLKQLVMRILKEMAEETAAKPAAKQRQKIYMVCSSVWDQRYSDFLSKLNDCSQYDVCPVIPGSWREKGYENRLRQAKSCGGVRYHSDGRPSDLGEAVTVFPVTARDLVVKAALCISDTFETSWITDCLEQSGRIVLLRSGLKPFTGQEPPAYTAQILSYYRTVLEYGIEICSSGELAGLKPAEQVGGPNDKGRPASYMGPVRTEPGAGNKRVITASNVEQFAADGVVFLNQGDIVTDLAKDRAKFLKIVFQ